MIVTIKDIAKALDVTSATVSRALNGKAGVSEKLRRQIVDTAEEMGYQPNAIAQGLVKKSTNTIGLIIPDITNPYYPMIARSIEEAAREQNYQLFLGNSNWEKDRENDLIRTMISNRVGGIIIDPATTDIGHILNSGIPTVFLANESKNDAVSYVGIDNVACGFKGIQHLYNKGYRRIAYIGGTENSFSNKERIQGYRDGLNACGLPIDEELIQSGEFTTEWGQQAAAALIKSVQPPDAYLTGNDLIAYGVLNALSEKGISVPEQVGVLGIDDIPTSALPQISLSSMGISRQNIGKKAFHQLQKLMKDMGVHEKHLMKPIIVERDTTNRKSL